MGGAPFPVFSPRPAPPRPPAAPPPGGSLRPEELLRGREGAEEKLKK